MHLTPNEVERFFKIWFSLLHYTNQKRRVVPSFPSKWGNVTVSPEVVLPLRDALWADDSLRESFIADNPAKLSANDLALVASWKYRIAGEFIIFRHLKKYTVFLSGDSPAHAYGVLGLSDSLEEMIGDYLPIYVQAVLLPFEDRIIYDSLLMPYRILFGGGIRADLNDAYRDVQEREGIIMSLPPSIENIDPEKLKKAVQARNKKVLTAFQKDLGQAGLSPKMIEEHTSKLADFADSFLLTHNPPLGLLDISSLSVKTYMDAQKGKANLVSFKRFAQFLRDTGRIDYDQVKSLLDFLKEERRGDKGE